MKCKNCDVNNEECAIYCINCGNRLKNSHTKNYIHSSGSIKTNSVKKTFIYTFIVAIFAIFQLHFYFLHFL